MRKTAQQPAQAQNVQAPAQPAVNAAPVMDVATMQAMLMQLMQQQAQAPAATAPTVQAPKATPQAVAEKVPGEAEAQAILATAKFVETRFTDKGKPYAVVSVKNGKREQRLTIWLAA